MNDILLSGIYTKGNEPSSCTVIECCYNALKPIYTELCIIGHDGFEKVLIK